MNQYRCETFETIGGIKKASKYRCETCGFNKPIGENAKYCSKASEISVIFMPEDDSNMYLGCASHSDFQSERDTVLDIGEILESLCKTDLYWYNKGVTEGEDVGKCRGKDCNYCGRYNAEPRQSKTDPVFISCNTPAHAFRLDLKNEQSERYCLWIEDDDGVYQTSCLHSFEFMDGTPEHNGIKYCPYCGKLIRQSKDGEL